MINWTDIIDVELITLPSYGSFEAAASSARHRKERGQRDSAQIRNAQVVDCGYNGKALALALSDDLVLTVFADSSGVQWTLDRAQSGLVEEPEMPDVMRVRRPSGAIQEWHWKRILAGLLHKKLRGIAPSDTLLSLYAHGVPDLLFTSAAIKGDGDQLLLFDEE